MQIIHLVSCCAAKVDLRECPSSRPHLPSPNLQFSTKHTEIGSWKTKAIMILVKRESEFPLLLLLTTNTRLERPIGSALINQSIHQC